MQLQMPIAVGYALQLLPNNHSSQNDLASHMYSTDTNHRQTHFKSS